MRHLILGCDAAGDVPLWEEGGTMLNSLPITMSDELLTALLGWNRQMTSVVASPEKFGADLAVLRTRLNGEGKALAARIEQESSGNIRVRYLPEVGTASR